MHLEYQISDKLLDLFETMPQFKIENTAIEIDAPAAPAAMTTLNAQICRGDNLWDKYFVGISGTSLPLGDWAQHGMPYDRLPIAITRQSFLWTLAAQGVLPMSLIPFGQSLLDPINFPLSVIPYQFMNDGGLNGGIVFVDVRIHTHTLIKASPLWLNTANLFLAIASGRNYMLQLTIAYFYGRFKQGVKGL